jgi:nitrate reductase NapAB chaperone NapD
MSKEKKEIKEINETLNKMLNKIKKLKELAIEYGEDDSKLIVWVESMERELHEGIENLTAEAKRRVKS